MGRRPRYSEPVAAAQSQTQQTLGSRTAETLDQTSRDLRDRFVAEYVKDFKPKLALIRTGHMNPETAACRANQLLHEPYVAQAIDAYIRSMKEDTIVMRQQIMAAMWKEANDEDNEGGVRVSALANCAKMMGMDKHPDSGPMTSPGVMFVPIMCVNEWQQTAMRSQEILKRQAAGVN